MEARPKPEVILVSRGGDWRLAFGCFQGAWSSYPLSICLSYPTSKRCSVNNGSGFGLLKWREKLTNAWFSTTYLLYLYPKSFRIPYRMSICLKNSGKMTNQARNVFAWSFWPSIFAPFRVPSEAQISPPKKLEPFWTSWSPSFYVGRLWQTLALVKTNQAPIRKHRDIFLALKWPCFVFFCKGSHGVVRAVGCGGRNIDPHGHIIWFHH